MQHIWGHFKTITHHKLLVMGYCFRVGLIRQGLAHDLSKYSPTEFRVGMKYYTGTKSPNASERDALGYSTAWLHHKGRNRHHLEYWIDYGGKGMDLIGHPMPTKYMVELCLDRIAACRVYHGSAYTDRDPLDYLIKSRDSKMMHPKTRAQVEAILTMLAEKGEKETLRYIRKTVLKNPVKCYPNLPEEYPGGNPEEKDPVFLPDGEILKIADKLPTPFYLYAEEEIASAADNLKAAFAWNPGFRQFFPVKATPTIGILRLLREQGQGLVCSSAAELESCRRAGFGPDEILFLPNFPREEDLKKAAETGCMPVLDSLELIEDFERFGLLGDTVGLRVRPDDVFVYGNSQAKMDGMKFALPASQVPEAVLRLKEKGVKKIGLHAYLSGNTLSPDYAPALVRFLLGLREKVEEQLPLAWLNISGGLGLAYRPGEKQLSFEEVGAAVKRVMEEKLGPEQAAAIPIYTEFGRAITGPGGILLTRVTLIKHAGRNFAGVDASASDLMRPMMYGAYHHVSKIGAKPGEKRENWDLVGAVCENTDKFAENRPLPALARGDLLAIHDAGAHGHSMGYNYGGRLRCGEYLYRRDGSLELLRRAENIEDYLRTQEAL